MRRHRRLLSFFAVAAGGRSSHPQYFLGGCCTQQPEGIHPLPGSSGARQQKSSCMQAQGGCYCGVGAGTHPPINDVHTARLFF